MKRLLVVLVLLLAACNNGQKIDDGLLSPRYWHDDEHGVSCWTYGGVSCLPDSQVQR